VLELVWGPLLVQGLEQMLAMEWEQQLELEPVQMLELVWAPS